eukprot:c6162_g1_i1.p1 GENE.c6162_g1_i1~~c6162_g1_i1.p1  ORF type:complete len:321 (-),score=69.18 c6162_g1_i1:110-1042(-)
MSSTPTTPHPVLSPFSQAQRFPYAIPTPHTGTIRKKLFEASKSSPAPQPTPSPSKQPTPTTFGLHNTPSPSHTPLRVHSRVTPRQSSPSPSPLPPSPSSASTLQRNLFPQSPNKLFRDAASRVETRSQNTQYFHQSLTSASTAATATQISQTDLAFMFRAASIPCKSAEDMFAMGTTVDSDTASSSRLQRSSQTYQHNLRRVYEFLHQSNLSMLAECAIEWEKVCRQVNVVPDAERLLEAIENDVIERNENHREEPFVVWFQQTILALWVKHSVSALPPPPTVENREQFATLSVRMEKWKHLSQQLSAKQ